MRVPRRPYIYPPLLAFLYLPLSGMTEAHAAAVWLPINIACIAISIALLVRTYARRLAVRLDTRTLPLVCLLTLIPVADKIKSEVRMFQSNALMVCASPVRWRRSNRSRS